MVAAGPLALCSGGRSTQSLQKGLRRAWSPLGPLLSAVSRDCRRACGARGRRWAPCSPQGLETAEGPAARVVAAGPLALCSGRRSTQSLQKGLRRAWSPLGPSLFAVAGAVPRASRRDCGARGRRWAPCGSVRYCHWDLQSNGAAGGPAARLQWQAQYPEPPEGPAARVVAAGPLALCSGRRSTQSLQKGLRRAWSPLGPLRFCALLPLGFAKQCSVQRLQKGLRRAWSPVGPSLSAVAGAGPRASRRDCGARGRRWAPAVLCVTAIVICKAMDVTGCESHCDGCGTRSHHSLTPSLTPALSAVSRDCRRGCGAVSRDCSRACGARGRRWAPRSLQWQAQYPEPPEGTAARVVAAGPPAALCVTAIRICKAMQCPEIAEGPAAHVVAGGPLDLCSGRRRTQSLQKGLRRVWSPLGPLRFCALLPL